MVTDAPKTMFSCALRFNLISVMYSLISILRTQYIQRRPHKKQGKIKEKCLFRCKLCHLFIVLYKHKAKETFIVIWIAWFVTGNRRSNLMFMFLSCGRKLKNLEEANKSKPHKERPEPGWTQNLLMLGARWAVPIVQNAEDTSSFCSPFAQFKLVQQTAPKCKSGSHKTA